MASAQVKGSRLSSHFEARGNCAVHKRLHAHSKRASERFVTGLILLDSTTSVGFIIKHSKSQTLTSLRATLRSESGLEETRGDTRHTLHAKVHTK